MENTFNQKRFRELLKKGIGNRTQKEFAEQVNMAQATISRMLNDEVISCPKVKTLEVFAAHMPNVSLSELMSACGYEMPGIEDAVAKMESDVEDFFAFGQSDNRLDVVADVDTLMKNMEAFLSRDTRKVRVMALLGEVTREMKDRGAEEAVHVSITWKYDCFACCTAFDLFYVETKSGKVIVIGSSITEEPDIREGYIRHTKVEDSREISRETRDIYAMLKEIIGADGKTCKVSPQTWAGAGFYYDKTPEGFLDFLNAHADTFCDSRENADMYRRVTEGEDADAVFADYEGHLHTFGTGAVVADIMRKESGDNYVYLTEDEEIPKEQRNACIMARNYYDLMEPIPKKQLIYIHQCAKELKIPEFGAVYYHTTCMELRGQCYKTDRFWENQD